LKEFCLKPAKTLLYERYLGKIMEKFYAQCLKRYVQKGCRAVVKLIIYCKSNALTKDTGVDDAA
jgi:hypothetical protein